MTYKDDDVFKQSGQSEVLKLIYSHTFVTKNFVKVTFILKEELIKEMISRKFLDKEFHWVLDKNSVKLTYY